MSKNLYLFFLFLSQQRKLRESSARQKAREDSRLDWGTQINQKHKSNEHVFFPAFFDIFEPLFWVFSFLSGLEFEDI